VWEKLRTGFLGFVAGLVAFFFGWLALRKNDPTPQPAPKPEPLPAELDPYLDPGKQEAVKQALADAARKKAEAEKKKADIEKEADDAHATDTVTWANDRYRGTPRS
jgi:hypothetical protein